MYNSKQRALAAAIKIASGNTCALQQAARHLRNGWVCKGWQALAWHLQATGANAQAQAYAAKMGGR